MLMYYLFLAVTFVVAVSWFRIRRRRKTGAAGSEAR